MGDPPRPPTPTKLSNYYSALNLPISASLKDIIKAYKSLAMKWHPDRNTSNSAEAQAKFSSINEAYRVLSLSKKEEGMFDENPETPKNMYNTEDDGFIISSPTLISTTSNRVAVPTTPGSTSRSSSRRSITPTPKLAETFANLSINSNASTSQTTPTTPPADAATLSKKMSRRNSRIIYSHSNSKVLKLPPVEKKLECTLEELCYGVVKTKKITRDVVSQYGAIVKEEETLSITVKPGWRQGTKITFEGKGDERPGFPPPDIIFVVDEKPHSLFRRKNNDLELKFKIEVPLVGALTGCTIDVPSLGGEDMSVPIDDIIYPGYEKIIPDQGMPKPRGTNSRGNLCLKFDVIFPTDLSDEQRAEIASILEDFS